MQITCLIPATPELHREVSTSIVCRPLSVGPWFLIIPNQVSAWEKEARARPMEGRALALTCSSTSGSSRASERTESSREGGAGGGWEAGWAERSGGVLWVSKVTVADRKVLTLASKGRGAYMS